MLVVVVVVVMLLFLFLSLACPSTAAGFRREDEEWRMKNEEGKTIRQCEAKAEERRRKEEGKGEREMGRCKVQSNVSISPRLAGRRVAGFLYLGPTGYSRQRYLPASAATQRYLARLGFNAYQERELRAGDGLERRALQHEFGREQVLTLLLQCKRSYGASYNLGSHATRCLVF